MEADFWGLRSNVPFVGGCFGSFVEKLLYKKIKIVMKLSYNKGFILLMCNILLFHKSVSDEHLLNRMFSQHSLQDPPQISGKDLAAVLAEKSGLATNAAVTSFLVNQKHGKTVEIFVFLIIPVYFRYKTEMNWHYFMNSISYYYWTGLSYSEEHHAWLWEDNSTLSQD
ncbi:hypothetical protein EI555_018183, partial [Monodon monoceros]